MRKIFLAFVLVGSYFISYAQKEPLTTPFAVPIDTVSKLITYQAVIDVKGTAANVLYSRILNWFNTYYKNPTEVIRENDSVKFSITGKPRFKLDNPAGAEGSKLDGGTVQYTITVAAKDGRFRYELTEFNWKQLSYFPSERWLDTKAASYLPIYNDYLQQIDKNSAEVIKSLINAATHEKKGEKKDDW
jgi:hypothetical protein